MSSWWLLLPCRACPHCPSSYITTVRQCGPQNTPCFLGVCMKTLRRDRQGQRHNKRRDCWRICQRWKEVYLEVVIAASSLWCDGAVLVLILGLADGLGRAVSVALLSCCCSALTESNPGPTPHRVCVFLGKRQQSGLWGKLFNSLTRVRCCAQMCVCCKSSLITQTRNQRDGWNVFFFPLFVKDTLFLADVAKEAWTTTGFRYNPSFPVTFTHTPASLSPSHFGMSAVWLFCSVLTPYLLTLTEQKIHNPSALCQTDNPNTSLCVCVRARVCAHRHASLCSPPCVLCLRGGRGDKGETKAQRRFEERKVMGLWGWTK